MSHPFAQYLDFANHHANATPADIEKLCEDVKTYGFHAAFVNQIYVPLAKSKGIRVGTVISFPLGQDSLQAKVAAIKACQADEFDIVPNIAALILDELTALVAAAKPAVVKFILDPGYFTKETLAQAAKLVQATGADFVKIGSGMGPREPTVEDVKIVREAVPTMKIKVAGGVDTYEEAKAFIDAGVARIGTSHAIEIITGTPMSSASTPVSSE